jgi:hypothetical protein
MVTISILRQELFPKRFIQWEDFANTNAVPILASRLHVQ